MTPEEQVRLAEIKRKFETNEAKFYFGVLALSMEEVQFVIDLAWEHRHDA